MNINFYLVKQSIYLCHLVVTIYAKAFFLLFSGLNETFLQVIGKKLPKYSSIHDRFVQNTHIIFNKNSRAKN
jgi:hypothetical protein